MLQSGGRTSGLPTERRMKAALAVAQVALALVLLVGSGLALRSLIRLWSIDPGFQPDGVASVGLTLPETLYRTRSPSAAIRGTAPGAAATGSGGHARLDLDDAALRASTHSGDYTVVGLPPRKTGDYLIAVYQRTSSDYFTALGLHILEGRGFRDADKDGAPLVALVSESLARRHWPAGQAVGHQLLLREIPEKSPKPSSASSRTSAWKGSTAGSRRRFICRSRNHRSDYVGHCDESAAGRSALHRRPRSCSRSIQPYLSAASGRSSTSWVTR